MKKAFLFWLLSHTALCFGWWDLPHMVIAKIAYDRLEPDVKKQADRFIKKFNAPFPGSKEFITASCFADDISKEGLKSFMCWHFSDIPYNPEGVLTDQQSREILRYQEGKDLIFAITQALYTFKQETATDWTKGFALNFLIHCVGDAHQPLHCAALYNNRFPSGEAGGNFFPIQWEGEKKQNLHIFWDSGCGLMMEQVKRPLNRSGRGIVNDWVARLTTKYPEESFKHAQDLDPCTWRAESFDLAVEYAYTGIQPGEAPSTTYIERGREVSAQQMTLAGYRLARLLNKTLKASSSLSLP